MKVSVIIPAFNAGQFINQTIDSILAQTYSDYEIIVVDDGSTDNTVKVVKNYGANVKYIYQENSGQGAARNTGIAAAKGDWIALLDHDDEWLPDKLSLQMELLKRNPALKWCATNRYQSDGIRRAVVGNSEVIEKSLDGKDYFENYFEAATKGVCPVITSTMLIQKVVFEEIGGFDPCLVRCDDLDMWWRIAYRYPAIGYLPEPLVIVHLNVEVAASTKTRLVVKQTPWSGELITRHLKLATEQGRMEVFKPYARKLLHKKLIEIIYHGHKEDARSTIKDFREFFPWHWRIGTYLLTIFPKLTSATAHIVAYMHYKLGLEKQVSRRWIRS
ncbi:MAG: glycosyltransferase family 2 protein [Planctomycetota bacterium]|jgi:glycosyltransferase involved in cell wall biosynthesis